MQPTLGAICRIEPQRRTPILARVIGFEQDAPLLAPLEEAEGIRAGDKIHVVEHSLRIGIGEQLCGRVIDALGRPLDQRPLPAGLRMRSVETAAPLPLERPPIRQAIATGVRAIDGLLTCGFGQRLGIFAGSGVGKSTLLSMLAKGTTADAVVIGLVGERGREVREFLDVALGEKGLARSVVVVATSDQPATLRIQAAWTATAIAETLRDAGKNVMLIVDSVTRLALAQRELGLAAREPPTTRGFPPSVFQLLPKLVERAGRTEKGSITAFYSVLVEGDDMNDPIADNLRGLLDGHIVLSRSLAESGQYPAIDILASLSRLQPHLVSRETSQAALVVRNRLAEYRRHEDLIAVGAYRTGSNALLDAAIQSRDPIRQFLMQGSEPLPFEATLTQLRQLAVPPLVAPGVNNTPTTHGR
jgi:flagellum-specific ATP synthase